MRNAKIYGSVPRQDNYSSNFLVKIKSTIHGTVVARLPESLTLQVSSEWDSPFSQGSGNPIVEISAQELLERSTKTQFASAQIWSGSSPIEITLSLEFYAQENARREVIQPIIQLGKMTLPRLTADANNTLGKALLIPPGPGIFNLRDSVERDNITISIGNFMNFTNVMIINADDTFSTKDMGVDGYPLRASCDVTFRTMFSFTGNELENSLTNSGG